jgi:hypothetical protein
MIISDPVQTAGISSRSEGAPTVVVGDQTRVLGL